MSSLGCLTQSLVAVQNLPWKNLNNWWSIQHQFHFSLCVRTYYSQTSVWISHQHSCSRFFKLQFVRDTHIIIHCQSTVCPEHKLYHPLSGCSLFGRTYCHPLSGQIWRFTPRDTQHLHHRTHNIYTLGHTKFSPFKWKDQICSAPR